MFISKEADRKLAGEELCGDNPFWRHDIWVIKKGT